MRLATVFTKKDCSVANLKRKQSNQDRTVKKYLQYYTLWLDSTLYFWYNTGIWNKRRK